MDSKNTHAWMATIRVRIYRRVFTEGVYGGKRKALEAAIRHRDHLITTLRPLTRRGFCSIKKKNNRSGIVGVTRITRVHRKQHRLGKPTSGWRCGRIAGNRSRQKKRFAVKKYGER